MLAFTKRYVVDFGIRTCVWFAIGFGISIYWEISLTTVMVYIVLTDVLSQRSAEAASHP